MTATHENPAPRHIADSAWQCQTCKGWFPVAIMARDCEKSH